MNAAQQENPIYMAVAGVIEMQEDNQFLGRPLFLKTIANQRTWLKLYNIRIHTWDNAKFRQKIAEVNDLRENLPLAV